MTETPRPKPWPIQNGMPMNGICRWASVRRLRVIISRVSAFTSRTPSTSPLPSIMRANFR